MPLHEEFVKSGNWLFRWRSYLPLFLLGLIILSFFHYDYLNHSSTLENMWGIVCLFISLLGLGIRIFTIGFTPEGTSGRNTEKQRADALNTLGIYSIVRHPLYLGNFLIWLGISLFMHIWWSTIICVLIFWLYYERIMFAEEEFLRNKFGSEYEKWASKTPAFLPKFKNWKTANLPFSLRNVLLREYSAFFAIIVIFTLLKVTSLIIVEGNVNLDLFWQITFLFGLLVYITLRTLKKKTKLLTVQGR